MGIYFQYILYSLVLILYLKCGGHSGLGWGVRWGAMFFSHFMLFTTFLEKKFWEYNFFFMFFFMLEILKSAPSLTGRWFRRWFLQIVDRDSVNLFPIYPLFPRSDFVSKMWGSQWFGVGGEVGCNVFLTFYAIYNISRKKILGIQFFFHVFFYAGNIEKCPFTYWLNIC